MDSPVKTPMKRVVMLANAGHKPFDTRIFHKEAKSLQRAGRDVVIIIPHTESVVHEDIKVVAVPLPGKGWEQLVLCPWRIFRLALSQPVNSIFHIHDSELLLVGLGLKLFRRTVIYDAHEDTPLQISYQHWIPRLIKKPYEWFYRVLEKCSGWWFDAIIVAEPVIAKYFPQGKVTLIRNFPIRASFPNEVAYAERSKALVYVGLLSKARGVVEMLRAHEIASKSVKIGFTMGGKFAPASLENELLPGHEVEYLSWLPYQEMVKTLYHSSIGIIVPHPIVRYKTNYPVKLFEYMAAGLPVIVSEEGESAAFVREANAGVLVDPLNVEKIAEAIVRLVSNPDLAAEMGRRGRNLIFEKYNWEGESEKLLQLYQRM